MGIGTGVLIPRVLTLLAISGTTAALPEIFLVFDVDDMVCCGSKVSMEGALTTFVDNYLENQKRIWC